MSERSINRVTLMGRIGQDIDVRFTPNGTQVGTFSLATTRRWKDSQSGEYKEKTDWHRIVLWRCDKLAQYLVKSKRIHLDGRIETRDYEDKDGVKRYVTEIVCDDLILLSHDQAQTSQAAQRPARQSNSTPPPAPDMSNDGLGITDDDVPF